MGAGAVGSYFGAKLALAGNEVHFIARGDHLRAMQTRGLQVQSRDSTMTIDHVRAMGDPKGVGPVDLVLFTVKATSTLEAAEAARPLLGPDTVVLGLQNGVENESMLAKTLGRERIVPGVAYIGVQRPSAGLILHTNLGNIALGEFDGRVSDRVVAIRDVLEDAGVHTSVSSDITSAKWRKLVWNAAFNPITAIHRKTVLDVLEDDGLRATAIAAMREVVDVGSALGHQVSEESIRKATAFSAELGRSRTSMLQDVEAGRPTEIDALCGAVVRAGRRVGVPTPVNTMLLETITQIVPGTIIQP